MLKELGKCAVFRARTVAELTGASPAYARLVLQRLAKAGQVLRIGRDAYTVHRDAFLVASRMAWPSYISVWSALRYHNLTEQVPHAVWVVTARKRRAEVRFADTLIMFIRTKPRLLFGYGKVDYRGFEVFMADPEKAVIDSLLFRRVSVSEMFGILKANIRTLNVGRLVGYAVKTGNGALIRRLGYMLDRLGRDTHRRLKKYVYPTPVALDYSLPAGGPVNGKWKVRENVRL